MKKTLLSFLCAGATCIAMGQQTKPVSDPNRTSTPTTTTSTPTTPNSTLNNNSSTNPNTNTNSTINKGTPTTPVTSGTGTVNGHNTMMNENRNYPGNNSMNNTPPNPTLNSGNTTLPANTNANGTTMDNGNTTTSGNLNTTTNNAAYSVSVPSSVQTSFSTAYPAAGSATWHQSGDWYRARYRENGRLMEASYREDGKAFTRIASPVLRTYVSEEVVNKALDMHGMNVYAIAMTKGADGQNIYNVTIIENGQSRIEWMNEDGSAVMSPYRTEMEDASTNTNATDSAKTIEAVPAKQADDVDSTIAKPVDNSIMKDDMTEEGEQQVIEQGTKQQQLEPGNQINTEGINNGRSSEDTLNNQEETIDEASPESAEAGSPSKE